MPLVSRVELQNVDREARVEIARKVGQLLCSENRSDDHETALELAQLLTEDVSIAVRTALSNQLRAAPHLPDELVVKLINDIEQVSIPFLIATNAVDDKCLMKLMASCSGLLQESIASRQEISEALTFTICDVGTVEAVSVLMSNDGAKLNESSATKVIERFPEEMTLLECMSKRADLPAEVVKSLIFKVSREYSEYLAQKFELTADYSEYIVSLAERQVFQQSLESFPDFEVHNYFCQLNEEGALTSELLFGYIQQGYVKIFTMALAARTGQSPKALKDALEMDSAKVIGELLTKCDYSRAVIGAIVVAFERQHARRV